jgi:rhodanese-related sulfurtransferase
MNWNWILIVGGVMAALFLLKRMSFVSAEVARQYLQQGALVIDVRSPDEFRRGHVPTALNIPLGELGESLPRRVKDKNQVLLLHCLSGGRSAMAKSRLKSVTGFTACRPPKPVTDRRSMLSRFQAACEISGLTICRARPSEPRLKTFA